MFAGAAKSEDEIEGAVGFLEVAKPGRPRDKGFNGEFHGSGGFTPLFSPWTGLWLWLRLRLHGVVGFVVWICGRGAPTLSLSPFHVSHLSVGVHGVVGLGEQCV